MSKKSSACRRANGNEEENWRTLRPSDTSHDRGMDYWEMCVWLAEQDYYRAVRTFGGKISQSDLAKVISDTVSLEEVLGTAVA